MKAVELAKAFDPKEFEDRIYELWSSGDFFAPTGNGEPFTDLGIVRIPPLAQPALQFLQRRRYQEDKHCLREGSLDLSRAVVLDVEQYVLPGIEVGQHRGTRRSVQVSRVLGPLEKATSFDCGFEFGAIDKHVVDAFLLTTTPLPSGPGHGEVKRKS